MADAAYPYTALARPSDEQTHEFILHQFEVLWDEYAEARATIPAGNLVEISYAELTANPDAALQRVYSALGIGGHGAAARRAAVAEHAALALAGYRKNTHPPLPKALREAVAARWGRYARAWGYEWGVEEDSVT